MAHVAHAAREARIVAAMEGNRLKLSDLTVSKIFTSPIRSDRLVLLDLLIDSRKWVQTDFLAHSTLSNPFLAPLVTPLDEHEANLMFYISRLTS